MPEDGFLARHTPRRRLPDRRGAWMLAMTLDPVRVAPFAVWYFRQEAIRLNDVGGWTIDDRQAFERNMLTCPPEWDS